MSVIRSSLGAELRFGGLAVVCGEAALSVILNMPASEAAPANHLRRLMRCEVGVGIEDSFCHITEYRKSLSETSGSLARSKSRLSFAFPGGGVPAQAAAGAQGFHGHDE